MNKTLIISTTGTSLLNSATSDRDLIINTACLTSKNIDGESKNQLDALIPIVIDNLAGDVALKSAELHGIERIYSEFGLQEKNVAHILIGSDTHQSELITGLLTSHLSTKGSLGITAIHPPKLGGENLKDFQTGIKNLVRGLLGSDGLLHSYMNGKYQIIVNTTAGFKPMASAMEILSPLFADKVASIFQGGNQLMVRKPISIESGFVSQFPADCLLLSQDEPIPRTVIHQSFPDSYLDDIDHEHVTFSDLGLAIFCKNKDQISLDNIRFPYIQFSEQVLKEIKVYPTHLLGILETFAKVSLLLVQSNGNLSILKSDGGIKYDEYAGQKSGKKIGHFRTSQAMRVVCEKSSDGKLFLHSYGTHDHTERQIQSF